ncbi:ATP-binding protein [Arenivirga flava]|uniref:Transcriptional regulator n=1 Tax=Arenivirga flava TaxID=1930060 RepID=A0AA37ULI8_9MICO|nr:ATP-binding protein [Arenivirga flava]GMA28722.1 transcriptional regulator [Arenivirga flava]
MVDTSRGPLPAIVERLRSAGTDLLEIEVKAAVGGLPSSIWPTVSAFSNQAGGVIILGLDENNGFLPADGFDPVAIRDAVADAFRPRAATEGQGKIAPRPLGSIDIAEVDGDPVVVIDVSELPSSMKPAFVTAQGKERGTYERVGDGDRRMSTYGVFLLSTDGQQPTDDGEPVTGADRSALDAGLVERFVTRIRERRPRSVVGLSTQEEILQRHNVLAADGQTPTLAGLLAFGVYPQEFFPQAMVTLAVYPGASKDSIVGDVRMLDRRTIEGSIPVMVDEAVRAVLGNLRTRRVSRGAGAADEAEIPVDALRESITNALTHRDYSSWALGDQVRIEMFPDRVEVRSPGGIWGGRRVTDLYDGSSRSRNALLATMLTETPLPDRDESVSENAGSGIPRMIGALGRAGLPAPRFDATVTSFTVVLDRHGLLSPEINAWLEQIGAGDLPLDHRLTLALFHRGLAVDGRLLRAQLAIDTEDAREILRTLVKESWLAFPAALDGPYREGPLLMRARTREQSFFPDIEVEESIERTRHDPAPRTALDEEILASVGSRGEASIHDIAADLDRQPPSLRQRLRVLVQQEALHATAPPQSRWRRYRLPEGPRSV